MSSLAILLLGPQARSLSGVSDHEIQNQVFLLRKNTFTSTASCRCKGAEGATGLCGGGPSLAAPWTLGPQGALLLADLGRESHSLWDVLSCLVCCSRLSVLSGRNRPPPMNGDIANCLLWVSPGRPEKWAAGWTRWGEQLPWDHLESNSKKINDFGPENELSIILGHRLTKSRILTLCYVWNGGRPDHIPCPHDATEGNPRSDGPSDQRPGNWQFPGEI